ncbi:hypothetical protein [Lentzea sp. NPDC004782]|uniref:hypothetical protein n=1 Tax=Lentzea sp. NPDC004782 TaxID=3154458 RepID=UPI0033B1C9D3
MGVALVLASGAGIVLGTVPASADTKFLSITLRYHGDKFPSRSDAINETRPEADRQCVAAFGFRAREVVPSQLFGVRNSSGTMDWKQTWDCYSN